MCVNRNFVYEEDDIIKVQNSSQTFELLVSVDRCPTCSVFLGDMITLNHTLHTIQTMGKCRCSVHTPEMI
jgi:hypothetical protein